MNAVAQVVRQQVISVGRDADQTIGSLPTLRPQPHYSKNALEGIRIADLITAALAPRAVGSRTARRLHVNAPAGPSTHTSIAMRQALTLAPVNNQGSALMCGFIDVRNKSAELRSYAAVAQQHRERFGKPLDVSREDFMALFGTVTTMLLSLGFQVRTAETMRPPAP